MRFAWGSATDIGRIRRENQDNLLTMPALWAVADGMGGHRGGETASGMTVDILSTAYSEPSLDSLHAAASQANAAVFLRAADDPELRGMGTTLVAIAPVPAPYDDYDVDADDGEDGDHPPEKPDQIPESVLAWINIGDSRLYRFQDGELEQITEDHSLVEEMVRDGRLSAEDARTHPQRNILTRALGIDRFPLIDGGTIIPYEGDRFLLCSDGLFNEVDEARIAATLRRLADPGDAADELVRLALEGGGRDNITVVVVDVLDDDASAARASAGIGAGTAQGHAEETRSSAATAAAPRRERRAERGPRRLTWRVLLFVLVLLALAGAAAYAVWHIARDGYTVKLRSSDSHVVIYKGNGSQVLWLGPQVEEVLAELAVVPSKQQAAKAGRKFDSLVCAEAYARQLTTAAAFNDPCTVPTTTTRPSTTTTASTTTTGPATTTTTLPAP